MKKLLGVVVLGLLWCNATYAADKVQIFKGYLKEKDEKVKLLTKAIYASYLDGCSGSNTKYYSLVDKVPDYVDSWVADTRSVEIFESTKLDINCLEKKFEHHQKNYPVESWSGGSVPFDEIIIRKQDTVSNGITFDMIVITSLFSQACGERCKFSNEVILIYKGRYWYMRGSNDNGVESKFINKDTILIKNLMTTHVRNYIFDINTKLFTSLPDGGLKFKKDHILVYGQKSYFEEVGGAFWFDSKINYAGERIELINSGNTCKDITGFYEGLQKTMMKQGLQEFCVTRY